MFGSQARFFLWDRYPISVSLADPVVVRVDCVDAVRLAVYEVFIRDDAIRISLLTRPLITERHKTDYFKRRHGQLSTKHVATHGYFVADAFTARLEERVPCFTEFSRPSLLLPYMQGAYLSEAERRQKALRNCAEIKEELMMVTWNPSRLVQCLDIDEVRDIVLVVL